MAPASRWVGLGVPARTKCASLGKARGTHRASRSVSVLEGATKYLNKKEAAKKRVSRYIAKRNILRHPSFQHWFLSQFFDRGYYFASSHHIGRLHDTLIVQLAPPALKCQRHGERPSDGCRDSAIRVRLGASALQVEVVSARPLKLLEPCGSYLSCHEDMIVSRGRSQRT